MWNIFWDTVPVLLRQIQKHKKTCLSNILPIYESNISDIFKMDPVQTLSYCLIRLEGYQVPWSYVGYMFIQHVGHVQTFFFTRSIQLCPSKILQFITFARSLRGKQGFIARDWLESIGLVLKFCQNFDPTISVPFQGRLNKLNLQATVIVDALEHLRNVWSINYKTLLTILIIT